MWIVIGRFLAGLLTFGITLPVWAFLAAGAWLYLDKTSSVRRAVDYAVTELVAGEELAAERAKAKATQEIADAANRLLERAQKANELFAERLSEVNEQNMELQNELDAVKALPIDPDGVVSPDLYGRLRNR